MSNKQFFIAFVVSLGGFLFGFDAGIISGVMTYVGPEFELNELQNGWVVSSPSFAAMLAMVFSGKLSDVFGRKKLLIVVALLYALSALLSALANSYELLYVARMLGGLAFGAALVLAPMYIAEISTAQNRGKLVTIQQLNIVFGFFAAFLSNYYFNKSNMLGHSFLTDQNVWRWMLGVEFFPATIYFIALFFVPKSPRWLTLKSRYDAAKTVLIGLYGQSQGEGEFSALSKSLSNEENQYQSSFKDLLKPSLRFIIIVGIVIGVMQQITGINAIYFYATSIFKQTGIGTEAAFSSGVLLSSISIVFTFAAIYLIDRMGRRPLLLVGMAGISVSLLLCAYGFSEATYKLTKAQIAEFEFTEANQLMILADKVYKSDVDFKNAVKAQIGAKVFIKNDGAILEASTTINPTLILIGILGFIACFAFSLGPVMWVLLSELYPLKYRGVIIGSIAFINSLMSFLVQLIFPWELSNLGSATTFLIFGLIASLGLFVCIKILPETKGKSLEALEEDLVINRT